MRKSFLQDSKPRGHDMTTGSIHVQINRDQKTKKVTNAIVSLVPVVDEDDLPLTLTKEADPNGKSPHELGAKLDAGKPSIYRGAIDYFPRAIEQVATVSTFGARKYAWKGWETVPDGVNRYSDALVRHLISEGKGESVDTDSGLLHASHCAWNALARLELILRNRNEN